MWQSVAFQFASNRYLCGDILAEETFFNFLIPQTSPKKYHNRPPFFFFSRYEEIRFKLSVTTTANNYTIRRSKYKIRWIIVSENGNKLTGIYLRFLLYSIQRSRKNIAAAPSDAYQ